MIVTIDLTIHTEHWTAQAMKKGQSISDWMTSALTKESAKTLAVGSAPARKRKAPAKKSSSTGSAGPADNASDHTSLNPVCIPGDSELPWATKYQPRTCDHLAVHKKKVAEVQQWLEFVLSSNCHHPILLLTGPPGCGKTATLNALSHDMSFSILEWTNPATGSKVEASNHGDLILFPESQSKQFQNFLMRANRYPSLLLSGGGSTNGISKVVLVEEFPNVFLRDPSEFHQLMKSVVNSLLYPLVFIATESHRGMSSPSRLFSKQVLCELDVHAISFNPVAHTNLVKTLQNITSLECSSQGHTSRGKGDVRGNTERIFYMPPREVIEHLAESSTGDVRSAINSLQFVCLKDATDLLRPSETAVTKRSGKSVKLLKQKSSSKLRKHSSTDLPRPLSTAIGGRDNPLFLFRALGKILYCKRDTECETTPSLPPPLKHRERRPLVVNPEVVLEHTHMSSDMFTQYLHQNYLDFFDSEYDVAEGVAYLSDSDLLARHWSDCKDTRSILQEYSGSVACRGLIFTNQSEAVGRWRPLHKPQWSNVFKQYSENCATARHLFLHLGASPFSHLWTPVELQTEILPFLAVINPPLRNTGQVSFLQTVTHFKAKGQRLGVETLDEKETADLFSRVDVDQGPLLESVHNNSAFSTDSNTHTVKTAAIANKLLSSQSSDTSQPPSQDISISVEGNSENDEIKDFDDDLIW